MHGCAWPLRAHPCRWSARPPQEHTAVSASAAVSEGALFVRGYHVVYLCVYPCIDACLHRWMDGWMYLLHTHPHPHNSRTHKLNAHTCHIFIRTDTGLRLQTHVRAHAHIHTDRQTVGEAEAPAQPRPKSRLEPKSKPKQVCVRLVAARLQSTRRRPCGIRHRYAVASKPSPARDCTRPDDPRPRATRCVGHTCTRAHTRARLSATSEGGRWLQGGNSGDWGEAFTDGERPRSTAAGSGRHVVLASSNEARRTRRSDSNCLRRRAADMKRKVDCGGVGRMQSKARNVQNLGCPPLRSGRDARD